MSFRLPTPDHPARQFLVDMRHVAEVLDPRNLDRLPTLAAAIREARRFTKQDRAVARISMICLNEASDERWLISVGRRGGWRREWNFGTGRD